MDDIILEFEERVQEVEVYSSFLEDISPEIGKEVSLKIMEGSSTIVKPMSDDLSKIMRANLFMLLYNLVESSFKRTLEQLCEEINNSETAYKGLIPEIRKIWLRHEKKYFTIGQPTDTNKLDYVYSVINDIANQVLTVPTSLVGCDISGNLDARSIRTCVTSYGITSEALNYTNGQKLLIVKNNRNNLAHGDLSFASCGGQYDFQELRIIKDEVILYMRSILNLIKSKIEDKYYHIA